MIERGLRRREKGALTVRVVEQRDGLTREVGLIDRGL